VKPSFVTDPNGQRSLLVELSLATPDSQRIAEAGIAIIEQLLRKNADYGSSAFMTPVLTPGTNVIDAMLTRMSDKVQRIGNLRKQSTDPNFSGRVGESFKDTVGDLAGYLILLLAHMESKVPVNHENRPIRRPLEEGPVNAITNTHSLLPVPEPVSGPHQCQSHTHESMPEVG